ncbi:MAG TPA: 2-oxoglutarate dehydrogenase E1 component [Candidatus Acidoferrales bacterium]|nr:2-oxoglutarate dehydrogenase E1 component [Candidatus Acidoferrales bacterium]
MAKRDPQRERVFDAFRHWGYLQADLDPLGYFQPQPHPELEQRGKAAAEARRYYCGTIGAEFMHIPDPERRRWIQERIETEPPEPDRPHILDRLIRAEVFEQFIQGRYPGTKRFSLEGNAALIPLLDETLEGATTQGAEEVVLAMSHRGRLSVMVHIVGKTATEILAKFEDVDPRSVLGSGDVKYHRGATGDYHTRSGHTVQVRLSSNPSHLEAVDPVVLGRVRAKQTRLGEKGPALVLPILLHGDAAFAGQGIWAETLNFSGLPGFSVGGAVHVIVNNLIGFTTGASELHTSRFASDVAKRLPIPVFHVNAEDPEAVARVARWAVDYRYTFGSDVVVDLIGFRRHGHSEIDDPTITQPLIYRKIEQHPPLWQVYADRIGAGPSATAEQFRAELVEAHKKAEAIEKKPVLSQLPDYWSGYKGGPYDPADEVDTGLETEDLLAITEGLTRYPEKFSIHPKVKRLLEQRAEMGRGKRSVDFGMAEALGFGSLLRQGIPVRLSGQDSRRGTFNQRHAVLFDTETEKEFLPLEHVGPAQARFEVYNSILSEAAVLGFEYGFSRDYPDALVLWEAQFGDFANNAQAIIDQFISAGEDKWGLLSGLVLLLPHGYEGQGPEHSSARIERFLQLAAEDNMQICQPSTAAQYFHLLRRQALSKWRKPLVVFTPKSTLRHPDAASPIEGFSRKRFLPVVAEPRLAETDRMLICTGKIGHELRRERQQREDHDTTVVFLEQLYPFPEAELAEEIGRHPRLREVIWVQEEPANMGALAYVLPRLEHIARRCPVRSVKRSASASPATGSAKAHEMEQKTLLALAFSTHQD